MDVSFSWDHVLFLPWIKAKMLIVIKKGDGEKIWSADYEYRGGWEQPGHEVNSPEQAALVMATRLTEEFLSDFGVTISH